MKIVDWHITRETGDVRSLLGMNTRTAWVLVAAFAITETTLYATSSEGVGPLWPGIVGLSLLAVCGFVLLAVDGDPLPRWITAAMVIAIPLVVFACLHAVPVPTTSPDQLWMYGAFTMVCTYMCVRGRVVGAWLVMILMIGATMLWGHQTGQGAMSGFAASSVNLGPMLMSTLFAATIRPAAKNIYELRRRSVEQNASLAAAVAAVAERDVRVRELNEVVVPILERIASPEPMTEAEREHCRTLEAQLRDSLRAPLLAGNTVTAAAAARARARGVEVIMVDGHGLDDASTEIRTDVLAGIADALDDTSAGSIVIRILPPLRSLIATVVVDQPDQDPTRLEFLPDGTLEREAGEVATPRAPTR